MLTWEWVCSACCARGTVRAVNPVGLMAIAAKIEGAHVRASLECAKCNGSCYIGYAGKGEGRALDR